MNDGPFLMIDADQAGVPFDIALVASLDAAIEHACSYVRWLDNDPDKLTWSWTEHDLSAETYLNGGRQYLHGVEPAGLVLSGRDDYGAWCAWLVAKPLNEVSRAWLALPPSEDEIAAFKKASCGGLFTTLSPRSDEQLDRAIADGLVAARAVLVHPPEETT